MRARVRMHELAWIGGVASLVAVGARSAVSAEVEAVEAVKAHTRPVALAVDARGDCLFVALSTADRLLGVDIGVGQVPRIVWDEPICDHPTSLAALPGRHGDDSHADGQGKRHLNLNRNRACEGGAGVVVSCRFDPDLRVVLPEGGGARPTVRRVRAGPEHGHRDVAVHPAGGYAYVGSFARGGVKVVDLSGTAAAPVGFRSTGAGATRLRIVNPTSAVNDPPLALIVANQIAHTVTVHRIESNGAVSEATQTIHTEAPVLDFQVTASALVLLTYEDRPITRARRDIEGLDSVMLVLPRKAGPILAFDDAGVGRRRQINLSEWPGAPVVAPEAAALWTDVGVAASVRMAVVGAGTDNVWISGALNLAAKPGNGDPEPDVVGIDVWRGLAPSSVDFEPRTQGARVLRVGSNPSALAFLPDSRLVTADRLSDTLSFVTWANAQAEGVVARARASSSSSSSVPLFASQSSSGSDGRAASIFTLAVGEPRRVAPVEIGELLFFSRALVPRNTADGPLSLYTCAACHVDGHIDGRRHPSKFNRFTSITKTCRGLSGTQPFLSLGRPANLAAFADNIVNTHAQGAAASPTTFDKYDVQLRRAVRRDNGTVDWLDGRVSADDLRVALAAFMASIPVEPSPFVKPGRTRLTRAERRGLQTFRASCAGCHRLAASTDARHPVAPPDKLERELLAGRVALTAAGRFDVGTPVLGDGGNNPPSLRGAWAAAPYFSDGSAATLEDVLARTDPSAAQVHAPRNARSRASAAAFSKRERADLLTFLRAL